jgi:hypothetical protein
MGSGGGPHLSDGQALGLMKCTAKTIGDNGKVSVYFSGDGATAVFNLNAEDAEYFTVRQKYEFKAVAS